jgi:3-keto-disaccharide hydrolase
VREYATGAIVNFVPVPVPSPFKAGGKWNSIDIRAVGPEVTVVLNGTETAHMKDTTYTSGPIGLQLSHGPQGNTTGAIKWRKVQVRPL